MAFTLSAARPDELPAACRALFAHRPVPDRDLAAARCRDLFDSGDADPAGLFVARNAEARIGGAVLVQTLPGALGLAWPPRAGSAEVEDALLAAACDWLRSRGAKVCQSFGAEDERADYAPLERAGFRRITRVVHLRRDLDTDLDAALVTEAPLVFESFGDHNRLEFIAALLATHDGSRDCPELTGRRSREEILAGFAGPLARRPEWWHLARVGGEPAGVVLFEVGTEPGALELNYLGLVPEARGRGWGEGLVRFAVAHAARTGHHALTLSVDERNEPALRLYRRAGFRPTDRRDVYLAAW